MSRKFDPFSPHLGFAGAVVICLCLALLGLSTLGADTEPAASLLVTRIEMILNEPGGHGDPMAQIAAAFDPNREVDDQQLAELAQSIINAEPGAFKKQVLAHATVDPASLSQTGNFAWKYGTFLQREKLRSLLWETAKSMAGSDPAKARILARAAILFRAMDDFPNGSYGLIRFLSDESGLKAAQISREMAGEIEKLRLDQSKLNPGYRTVGQQVDRLIKHPDTKEFSLALTKMDEWLKGGLNTVDENLFACYALQLTNHATAMDNAEVKRQLADRFATWSKDADQAFQNWLKQAQTSNGKPQRVYFLTLEKDGQRVETDSDGNIPQ